jgi:hypothetical protein
MAEGHGRDEWGRWSVLLALTANCHRDPQKGRPAKPADFDPYCRKQKRRQPEVADKESLQLLRQALEAGKERIW